MLQHSEKKYILRSGLSSKLEGCTSESKTTVRTTMEKLAVEIVINYVHTDNKLCNSYNFNHWFFNQQL